MPDIQTLHTSRGFSVVELMVTIAVLAIILGIGMPSFQNMLENSRLNSAAESLADSFRFARSEAIARNTSVQTDGTYSNGWTVTAGGTVLREYKAFNSQVGIDEDDAVVFNGRGMADDDREFTLTSNGKTRCVRVLLSGNVRLYDEGCP